MHSNFVLMRDRNSCEGTLFFTKKILKQTRLDYYPSFAETEDKKKTCLIPQTVQD